MFDSAKYRKMLESDLAELLRLQKEHEKRVNDNSNRKKEVEAKALELEKEGRAIQQQIEQLKQMTATLDLPRNGFVRQTEEFPATAAMYHFKKSLIQPDRGLIKNVRAVVHGVGKHRLWPTDLRDILVDCGYPDSKNLLPEIHAALRRLEKRGEIAIVKLFDGRKVGYRSRGMSAMRRSNGTKRNSQSASEGRQAVKAKH